MKLAGVVIIALGAQSPSLQAILQYEGPARLAVDEEDMFADANAMSVATQSLSQNLFEYVNQHQLPTYKLTDNAQAKLNAIFNQVHYLRFVKELWVKKCLAADAEIPTCYEDAWGELSELGTHLMGTAYRHWLEAPNAWKDVTIMCIYYTQFIDLPETGRSAVCHIVANVMKAARSAALVSTDHSFRERDKWMANYTYMFNEQTAEKQSIQDLLDAHIIDAYIDQVAASDTEKNQLKNYGTIDKISKIWESAVKQAPSTGSDKPIDIETMKKVIAIHTWARKRGHVLDVNLAQTWYNSPYHKIVVTYRLLEPIILCLLLALNGE